MDNIWTAVGTIMMAVVLAPFVKDQEESTEMGRNRRKNKRKRQKRKQKEKLKKQKCATLFYTSGVKNVVRSVGEGSPSNQDVHTSSS